MALWACTHEDSNGNSKTVFHDGDRCTDGNENVDCLYFYQGLTFVSCLRRVFALEGDHVIAIDPGEFGEQEQRK